MSRRIYSSGLCALVLAFSSISICHAETLSLGLIAFDNLIPSAPNAPGVNVFSINNFTGDPAKGGFALPPDFPVLNSVLFDDSTLSLKTNSGTVSFLLGNLGPGSYTPVALEFPATTDFSSATFTATLSTANLPLPSGPFFASSEFVSVNVVPSFGATLTPGVDFALVQVSSIPEPATAALCGVAVLLFVAFRSRRYRTVSRYTRS